MNLTGLVRALHERGRDKMTDPYYLAGDDWLAISNELKGHPHVKERWGGALLHSYDAPGPNFLVMGVPICMAEESAQT